MACCQGITGRKLVVKDAHVLEVGQVLCLLLQDGQSVVSSADLLPKALYKLRKLGLYVPDVDVGAPNHRHHVLVVIGILHKEPAV